MSYHNGVKQDILSPSLFNVV